MQDILATVTAWQKAEKSIAIATVVQTWGSSPRPIGAKMVITTEMDIVGSVSGGCVESAVIQETLAVLEDGQPRLLHFGVSDETARSVGLACGGEIEVYIEPLNLGWWQAIQGKIITNQVIATLTVLAGEWAGHKLIVQNGNIEFATLELSSTSQNKLLKRIRQKSLVTERITQADWDVLVDVYEPRPQIIMIGGVHVAVHLQVFAKELGYTVQLIDPRRAFATTERFPQVDQILHQYPAEAFEQINWNSQTYLVILSHDPKIDDPALQIALTKNLPYIGVMSSRATHRKRTERLRLLGITDEQLAQIKTPIGLHIHAKTPAEIALSIMAEIVAVRNNVTPS